MSKFNKISVFIIIMLLISGGITTFAYQKVQNRKTSIKSVNSSGNLYVNDDSELVCKAKAFSLPQKTAVKTKTAATKTAALKTSSPSVKSSSAKSTVKTASVSKASTKTAAVKTAAKSKTAVSSKTAASSRTTTARKVVASRGETKSLQIVNMALQYVGYKYVYGGSTPSTGFDCSGFTMYIYGKLSVALPHSAREQYSYGTRIKSISDLKAGDLVFFYTPIGHVGIYIGNGKFVHASNPRDGVKITDINTTSYAKEFVGGVRIFN